MEKKTRYTIVAGIVSALVLGLGLRSCLKDKFRSIVLKPNEPVVIKPNDGSGHGTVVTKKPNGDVVIIPKTRGFSFDPGLYAGIGGMGIGLEIAYWHRLNLLAGVQCYPLVPNAMVAIGYRLPYDRFSNLSIYAGITARKEPTVGIFLRFGNS